MTDGEEPAPPRRAAKPGDETSVGGEPSPLVGAAAGLGKVVGAVALLAAAAAIIAAVVALLY